MADTDIVTRLAREAYDSVRERLRMHVVQPEFLAVFAALVAEECAKVCDSLVPPLERFDDQRAAGNTARRAASAIRSLLVTKEAP